MTLGPGLVSAVLEQVRSGEVARAAQEGAASPSAVPTHGDLIETPYLQLVLTKLWKAETASGSTVLRVETLQGALGGAATIVRRHLGEVMASLTPDLVPLAAEIFGHLVTPSGSKIALTASDLAHFTGAPADRVTRVLEWLADADRRVLKPVPPPRGTDGETRYEVYHDVLGRAVVEWTGTYRAQAQQRRAAERLEREREEALAAARAARRRLRRARLVALGLAAVLVLVTVLGVRLAGALREARAAQDRANAQRDLLRSADLLGSDPAASLAEAAKAFARVPDPQSEEAVLKTLDAPRSVVVARRADGIAVTRDHMAIVSYSGSGGGLALKVQSARSSGDASDWVPLTRWSGTVFSAAANHDASQVALTDWSGRAFLVSTSDGHVTDLDLGRAGDGNAVATFVTGAAGEQVAVTADRHIHVFDVPSGRRTATLALAHAVLAATATASQVVTLDADRRLRVWDPTSAVPRFRSSPLEPGLDLTGVRLVATEEGTAVAAVAPPTGHLRLVVWPWRTGGPPTSYDGGAQTVNHRVSVSETGRFVTVAMDRTARQFDLTTRSWRPALPQHSDTVLAAQTSRRGGIRMVTAGGDGRIRYWSVLSPSAPGYELVGHRGPVLDLVYVGANRRNVISLGADRTVRMWRLPDTHRYNEHRGPVIGLEGATGSRYMISTSRDRAALLWLTADRSDFAPGSPTLVAPPGQHLKAVLPRLSGGKRQAVVLYEASGTPELWAWHQKGATLVRRLDPLGQHHTIASMALSADGRTLRAADTLGRISAWDVDTGRLLPGSQELGDVAELAFDPSGRWYATATATGVTLMPAAGQSSGQPLHCPAALPDCLLRAAHLAFSSDGTRIAVTTEQGDLYVWDTAGALIRGPLEFRGGSLGRPSLNADGSLLVAGNAQGQVQVWDVGTGAVILQAHRHPTSVNAVLFAAHDSRVITASDDRTAAVFPCLPCTDRQAALQQLLAWTRHPEIGG